MCEVTQFLLHTRNLIHISDCSVFQRKALGFSGHCFSFLCLDLDLEGSPFGCFGVVILYEWSAQETNEG